MSLFNNWLQTPILHKTKITNFEFLKEHLLITHLDSDYYYLNSNLTIDLELYYYKEKNKEMAAKLNITDIDTSLKEFIHDLNVYNEIKDVADALMGKISELRGVSLKSVRENMNLDGIE